MRAVRIVLAALLGGLSFVLLTAAPSVACSCAGMSTAEHVEWSDVVVAGTIDSREESDVPAVTSTVAYAVTVAATFKGEADGTIEVISHGDGASCGLEEIRLGEDYVVFAKHQTIMGEPSDRLWTSLCSGTALATPQLAAEVEAAAVDGPSPPSTATPMSVEAEDTVAPIADQEDAAEVGGGWAGPAFFVGVAVLAGVAIARWARHRRA